MHLLGLFESKRPTKHEALKAFKNKNCLNCLKPKAYAPNPPNPELLSFPVQLRGEQPGLPSSGNTLNSSFDKIRVLLEDEVSKGPYQVDDSSDELYVKIL